VTDKTDRPSKQVVMQRGRNRIIEGLETASSFDAQREYQRRVPIHVPHEIINGWGDQVVAPINADRYPHPVFTQAERDAMAEYDRVLNEVSGATPGRLPPLEETLRLPQWHRLRDAAERALTVFLVRGRLPEDEEFAAS